MVRLWMALLIACGSPTEPTSDAPPRGAVHVVLFTHIEDNTPGGVIGTTTSRTSYMNLRARLIELAERSRSHGLAWSLQPDWKYLEAARVYEDAQTMATTGGKNVFRYLHEDLGVAIDPHSHESGGYNYSDVAHLLGVLGVGGSTVIGGHIWDPALPSFQAWDRFRVPVAGIKYPEVMWRGALLIGAGTPNHVNDPLVSGVWRPRDRDHFFDDDPDGNIVAVGSWHDDVAGVEELVALAPSHDMMLTASWNIRPTTITALGGIDEIERSVLAPIAAMRDRGEIVVTDFRSLVTTWQTAYGGRAQLYQP